MNHPPNDDEGTPPDLSSRVMTHHQFRREMNRIRRLNRRRRPFYRVAAEGTVRYIKRFNWKSGLGFTLIGCGTVYGGYWIFCLDGGSTIVTAAGAIGGYLGMQSPMQPFNDIDPMNGIDVDMDVHHVGRGLLKSKNDHRNASDFEDIQKEYGKHIHPIESNGKDEGKRSRVYRALARVKSDVHRNGATINEKEEANAIEKAISHSRAGRPTPFKDKKTKSLVKRSEDEIPKNFSKLLPFRILLRFAIEYKMNLVVHVQIHDPKTKNYTKEKWYIMAGDSDITRTGFLYAAVWRTNKSWKPFRGNDDEFRRSWDWMDTDNTDGTLPEGMRRDQIHVEQMATGKAAPFGPVNMTDKTYTDPLPQHAVPRQEAPVSQQPVEQKSGQKPPGPQPPGLQQPVQPESGPQPPGPQSGPQPPGQQAPVYQQPGQQPPVYQQSGQQPPVYQQPGQQPPVYQQSGQQQPVYQQSNSGPPSGGDASYQRRRRVEEEKKEKKEEDYKRAIIVFVVFLTSGLLCACVCAVLIAALRILNQREANRAQAEEQVSHPPVYQDYV